MAYDPCAPSVPPPPVAAPVHHHHHIHRIVGRVKARPRAPIHRIAAVPNPDGCAQPTSGVGPGKLAPIAGAGLASGLGTGLVTHPTILPPATPPGTPVVPIIPIITPPGPPVVPPHHHHTTPPTPVPEPTTLVVFAMALLALWMARSVSKHRPLACRAI